MDEEVSIGQQYALKWNEFHTKVVSSFQELRNDSDFVDVTIACDGSSFSAHKVILSACSPYFRKLLKANPCQHPIIIFRDVRKQNMENILLFMYKGEVQLEPNQFSEFLTAAKMLQIEGLTKIKNNFNPACIETNTDDETEQNLVTRSERNRKSASPPPTKLLTNLSRKNCHSRSVSMDQDSEISEPGQHENIPSPKDIKVDEIIVDDDEPINPKLEPCDETSSSEHRKDNSGIRDEMVHNSDAFIVTSDNNLHEASHTESFEMLQNMKRQSYRSANRTTSKTDSTQCPMCQRNYSTASNLKAHILNVHTPPSLNNWYQCSQCGKNCKTKHYLINHEMRAHGIRQRNKRTVFSFLNEDTL